MKLTLRRYSLLLIFQLIFLLADLFINSFSYLAHNNRSVMILMFLCQDIFIIFSYVLFGFHVYSTYVFQAGVADILCKKFRLPLAAITFYFILSVAHHFWIILNQHKHGIFEQWPTGLTALFILQRLFSPVYYYLFKRTALRMSDPRFHENMDWIAEQLSIEYKST